MEEDSILTIIQKVKKGDIACFNDLIINFEKQVFSLALRIVKNHEDAEEVAQDSFVKAYQRIRTFRENAKFSTWLYRITYNNALNKISANRRIFLQDEIHENSLGESSKDESMSLLRDKERRDYIKQAMINLKPQESMLITLYYQNECSLQEIEDITGINKNSVKVQLHRARRRLAEELKLLLNNEIESLQ